MKRGKRRTNIEQEWEDVRVDVEEARKNRPKYEITLHPCGLRKKFKPAISIKFNLAQVSNQAQWRNETGGQPLFPPSKLPHGPRGPQLRLPTIILKGRPLSEIYGFTWNFRLKLCPSDQRVIPISVKPSHRKLYLSRFNRAGRFYCVQNSNTNI